MPLSPQAQKTLTAFFDDFGTSSRVVKNAARRMKISESEAAEAASIYENGQGHPARQREIRESAERTVDQANKAEGDLRHASIKELESLAFMKFGRS